MTKATVEARTAAIVDYISRSPGEMIARGDSCDFYVTAANTLVAGDSIMFRSRNGFFWLLLLVLLWSVVENPASAASKQVARGHALYLQYCASCHGVTAEGDGPIARSLITPPANLRRLDERFGNPLPEDQVARYIDGRAEVKAHGPRDMPVWGNRFYYKSGTDEHRAQQWIAQLVAYLQSIQSPIHQASVKGSFLASLTARVARR